MPQMCDKCFSKALSLIYERESLYGIQDLEVKLVLWVYSRLCTILCTVPPQKQP